MAGVSLVLGTVDGGFSRLRACIAVQRPSKSTDWLLCIERFTYLEPFFVPSLPRGHKRQLLLSRLAVYDTRSQLCLS
jgi:hypothetical protein